MLLAALCPSMYRSVRVSNMSTIIAALIGWAALELFRGDGPRGAIAIALGTVTKYIGAALLPLALVAGRWRTVLWSGAFTCAVRNHRLDERY